MLDQRIAEDRQVRDDLWLQILVDSYRAEDEGPSLEVEFRSEAEQLRLRHAGDRLELFDGGGRDPDLIVELAELPLKEVLLGRVSPGHLIDTARIDTGNRSRRFAPALEEGLSSQGSFERIPGATLSVGIHVTQTVAGEVGICERWRDGALLSTDVVPIADLMATTTDIRLSCSLSELAAVRRAELTPLDAIAGGIGVFGEWPQLMCLAELVQHPAYRAAWEADPTLDAEAAWGAIFCSSQYGDAAVRALIEPPR